MSLPNSTVYENSLHSLCSEQKTYRRVACPIWCKTPPIVVQLLCNPKGTSGERFGDVGVTHFCVEHGIVQVALWPGQLEVFLDELGAIFTSESYVLVEPHC